MAAVRDLQTELSVVERSLIALQELRRQEPGTILFREGGDAHGAFIIHSGAIDLVYASRDGALRPLQVATGGQILGLSSVVTRRKHDATAVVRTASELGYVEASKLMLLLERDPAAWFGVLQLLSQDVSASWDSMRRLNHAR
jgi:CRP-like cAMP-binding protein